MIQLELTDTAEQQVALLCDRCGRCWFRSPGTTDDELRNAAVNRGWHVDHLADTCPHCVTNERAQQRARDKKERDQL